MEASISTTPIGTDAGHSLQPLLISWCRQSVWLDFLRGWPLPAVGHPIACIQQEAECPDEAKEAIDSLACRLGKDALGYDTQRLYHKEAEGVILWVARLPRCSVVDCKCASATSLLGYCKRLQLSCIQPETTKAPTAPAAVASCFPPPTACTVRLTVFEPSCTKIRLNRPCHLFPQNSCKEVDLCGWRINLGQPRTSNGRGVIEVGRNARKETLKSHTARLSAA